MPDTIKKTKYNTFDLVDVVDLYGQVLCDTRVGKCKILHTNKKNETVFVINIKTLDIYSFKCIDIKLNLKPLSKLDQKDLKIIFCLTTDSVAFDGTILKQSNGIVLSYDDYQIMINVINGFEIEVYRDNIPVPTKNLNYILLYLMKNGYDVYNLISKKYAITTNK